MKYSTRMLTLLVFLVTFAPVAYAEGFQGDVAGGFQSSAYRTNGASLVYGSGLDLRAHVGYRFSERWKLELGPEFKYSDAADFTVRETILTAGFNYQFLDRPDFLRFSLGLASALLSLTDSPEVRDRAHASRVWLTGPAAEISWGKNLISATNKPWFLELGVSYQKLDNTMKSFSMFAVVGLPIN